MDIATPALQVYPDRRLSEFTAPAGDVLAATIGQAFHDLPVAEINRSTDRYLAEHGQPTRAGTYMFAPGTATPLLSTEDAQAKIKDAGLDGQLTAPTDGMRQGSLDLLIQNRLDQNRRASIISRSPGGVVLGATNLAATLAVSLLDPVNDAMGFMPVIGEARYAKMLASAGESVVGRTAVRAGVGAVEGAAGMAALQPLQLASAKIDQDQYGINDALANILYGGVFGAVLHNIGPAIEGGYRLSRGRPLIEKQAAAAEAISALLEDRPPRVGEMLESMRREKLLGSTSTAALQPATEPRFGEAPTVRPELQPLSPEDAAAQRIQDVNARAREIDPQTFAEHDRLQTERQTYTRWIDELGQTRGKNAETSVTGLDQEIARARQQLDGATPRKAKIYQKRLDDLQAQRDSRVTEATHADTPDMQTVRQKLQQADFRMRDLAEKVSAVQRQAEQDVPAAGVTPAAPAEPATPPAPFDAQAALAGATQAPSLMDTLTQIRNDRVNLSPRDAAAIAAVKTAAKGYDAPTTDGGLAELTTYATDTNDALAVAAQAETLSPEELAHVQEADEMVSNSEKIANGLKAATQCVARAI